MPSSGIAGPIPTPKLGFNVVLPTCSKILGLLILVKTVFSGRRLVILRWTRELTSQRALVLLWTCGRFRANMSSDKVHDEGPEPSTRAHEGEKRVLHSACRDNVSFVHSTHLVSRTVSSVSHYCNCPSRLAVYKMNCASCAGEAGRFLPGQVQVPKVMKNLHFTGSHFPRKKLANPRRTLFSTDSDGLPTALPPWEPPAPVITT